MGFLRGRWRKPHAPVWGARPSSSMASILIVDDEPGIREFVADALAADGHEPVQAADGATAVAELHARAFDLMITDLKMPGVLCGVGLLRKARSEQPDMEVIVLTAHGSVK